MANIEVRDGDGLEKFFKATGAGTDGDPFVREVLETNSADILVDTDAINTNIAAILADTANIDTNLAAIAGTVSGSELQIDVLSLPSIPAGTNNIGDVDVASITQPTAIIQEVASVTTAGTRVQLSSATVAAAVTVTALAANTGTIYVGNSSVSSSAYGWKLAANESTGPIVIDNTNKLYIDSSENGDGVSVGGS